MELDHQNLTDFRTFTNYTCILACRAIEYQKRDLFWWAMERAEFSLEDIKISVVASPTIELLLLFKDKSCFTGAEKERLLNCDDPRIRKFAEEIPCVASNFYSLIR